jgi:aldose 1-epimerase
MAAPPSGEQFEIVHGEQRATIVEVGGGVREYRVAERDVLDPYPRQSICDGAHGAVLIPWPNRLADGRYSFDGTVHQLPLTEPERHNAIHGLVRWRAWRAVEQRPERVLMGIRIHPRPGWPFALDVTVGYRLSDEGLEVETRARNIGDGPCPFGSGQHPYLSPGSGLVDGCSVELRAAMRILTDPDRQLPTGYESVAGTPFDLSSRRPLRDLTLDDGFTGLERDDDGRAWVRLACPDGAVVEMWCDERYPFVQLYSGDTLAAARRRRALAAEPMTCPANALQTGEGIVRLEPGEAFVGRWGVRLA